MTGSADLVVVLLGASAAVLERTRRDAIDRQFEDAHESVPCVRSANA